MWEMIKNMLVGAKDTLGIELPELPVDLGALGESATGALDALTPVSEAVAGGVADVSQTVSELPTDALDSASQALPGLPDLPLGGDPTR
jgi:hypothetical protein